jgi:uncharacterized DUF497 family protein
VNYSWIVRVVWDESKSRTNWKKHGVSFEEASALFSRGDDYLEIFDDAHSDEEDRFIAIGPIKKGLVLVVYTERDEDTVRLISARWATRRETELFHSHVQGGP